MLSLIPIFTLVAAVSGEYCYATSGGTCLTKSQAADWQGSYYGDNDVCFPYGSGKVSILNLARREKFM